MNALIRKGGKLSDISKEFDKQVDSHPMVVAHEKMNKHKLPVLRKVVKYFNIKGVSTKNKDTVIHALIKAGWDGVVPDDLE